MRSCGSPTRHSRTAFTLMEVMVVAGVIAVLIAILVPALAGALRTANMAKSQTRLKQIHTWMQNYSSENREYIVPSQFDYTGSAANYAVKVRSDADLPAGERFVGTWTDILWTYGGMGSKQALLDSSQPANTDKYMFDSPDKAAYESDRDYESPLRSTAANTKEYAPGNGIPVGLPGGTGAQESGLPGYFAANNFFNTTGIGGKWYVTGQIKAPERSMYLVDSLAGETIEPDGAVNGPWDNPAMDPAATAPAPNFQVDFRYNGACLMLMLDGHSEAQAPWRDLADLQGASRKVKVQNLTKN